MLALLEIHLNSVNSHPVVASSRSKVSMRISVEQYRSRIGFHNHFANAKDALSRFKDQFWNMMRVAPITDNDVVLWKICYNSWSQDINSHAKIETSCHTIQIWNEVMLWLTQMMCYKMYIPLLIRQTNDVEENLNPTIFDVIYPTIIFSE